MKNGKRWLQGFGVTEAVVAIGLLGVAFTQLSKFMQTYQNNVRSLEVFNEVNFLHLDIRRALWIPSTCNLTFSALPLSANPSVTQINHADRGVLYRTNTNYRNDRVRLSSMAVRNFVAVSATEDRFDLSLSYEGRGFLAGNAPAITRTIPIRVEKRGGAFYTCFMDGDQVLRNSYVRQDHGVGAPAEVKNGDFRVFGFLTVQTLASTGGSLKAQEYLSLSDERAKSDIRTLDSAGPRLADLQGYRYRMNGRPHLGLLAQEVEAKSPEIVQSNDAGLRLLRYDGVAPLLVEGIKAAREDQHERENEIRDLERRLSALERR